MHQVTAPRPRRFSVLLLQCVFLNTIVAKKVDSRSNESSCLADRSRLGEIM